MNGPFKWLEQLLGGNGDDGWDDTTAREQGNRGEDTGDSGSPDYGADK